MHVETIEASSNAHHGQESTLARSFQERPLQTPFEFPFLHHAIPENAEDATQHNLAYLLRYGLLQTEAATQRHMVAGIARFTKMLFPACEDAALDVATDALAWSACCADSYTRMRKEANADEASAIIWQLVNLTLRHVGIEPKEEAHPLVWAFANLWKREAAGMSASWQLRAAADWRGWFLRVASEAIRCESTFEWPEGSNALVHVESGCAVFSDLIEGSLKFELPRGAYESAEIQGLLGICATSMRWVSDVFVAQVSNDRDVRDTIVATVRKELECGKEEAIREVVRMHKQLMDRWCEFRSGLRSLCDVLRLSDEEQNRIQRYIANLESFIAGYYEWHLVSCRENGISR